MGMLPGKKKKNSYSLFIEKGQGRGARDSEVIRAKKNVSGFWNGLNYYSYSNVYINTRINW